MAQDIVGLTAKLFELRRRRCESLFEMLETFHRRQSDSTAAGSILAWMSCTRECDGCVRDGYQLAHPSGEHLEVPI